MKYVVCLIIEVGKVGVWSVLCDFDINKYFLLEYEGGFFKVKIEVVNGCYGVYVIGVKGDK